MVVITRAAAKRQQQSSNADSIVLHRNIIKKKQKKQVAGQHASSCISSSSPLQSNAITSTSCTFALSAFNTPNSNEYLINTPITTTASSSRFELCDHQNQNDVIGINDSNQFISLPSMEFNQTDNNQQDQIHDVEDNDESGTKTSWPIIVGEIQWCKTNRGNDRMCMCGYTYDFMSQTLKKNIRYFRCSKKNIGCNAVVRICIDSNMYKDSNNVEHNHPPDHHNVKRLLVLQKIKERVMVEPTSVTRIIEDEYVKHHLNDGDREKFLLPASQASKFYKIRAKMVPSNPKSMNFKVPQLYSTTHDDDEFLIYDSIHKKIGGRLMIFSTEVLIKILCSCEIIFVDGTFKTRPIMFSQVYVIMGMHLAEAIPLVWCLTPKREEEVYEKIFKVLKRKSIEYGVKLEPKYAYADFESGTINALEKVFPDIIVRGCWYHFTQSVFRNIQKMGLSTVYEKNKEVNIWLKSFMALPLIKNDILDAAVELLIKNVPSSDKSLIDFYEYFQRQWFTRKPPRYWSLGPIHIRCNNSLEGYNNRLKYRFGIHPQLWPFIHFLKAEESLVMMRATQIRNGIYRYKTMPFSANNERLRKKTKQLKNLSRLFQLGSISLNRYITNLSTFVGEAAKKKKKNNNDIHNATIDDSRIDDDNI
ncbi:unnamed protein product [Rotaria sp. Silwood2]|nr:unnamed protein product [Rotaria sp. Silwood2]CAF4456019.1 unnamed protein product [Rotaria sp. Silwood2]